MVFKHFLSIFLRARPSSEFDRVCVCRSVCVCVRCACGWCAWGEGVVLLVAVNLPPNSSLRGGLIRIWGVKNLPPPPTPRFLIRGTKKLPHPTPTPTHSTSPLVFEKNASWGANFYPPHLGGWCVCVCVCGVEKKFAPPPTKISVVRHSMVLRCWLRCWGVDWGVEVWKYIKCAIIRKICAGNFQNFRSLFSPTVVFPKDLNRFSAQFSNVIASKVYQLREKIFEFKLTFIFFARFARA